MSKNRLDKKIKEVLEKRRLTPSEGAWQAVEERLGPPVASRKPVVLWYAIAASFVGILWITFFTSDVNPETELPTENTVGTDAGPASIEILNTEQMKAPEGDALVVLPVPEKAIKTDPGNHLKQTFPPQREDGTTTGEIAAETPWSTDNLERKVAEVVAQVALLEDMGVAVEDRVIDSLLMAAQKQVWEERVIDKDRGIDAMALLSDVEGELNRSLRDQLFEKLKEGYLKVRDVVAYRNE